MTLNLFKTKKICFFAMNQCKIDSRVYVNVIRNLKDDFQVFVNIQNKNFALGRLRPSPLHRLFSLIQYCSAMRVLRLSHWVHTHSSERITQKSPVSTLWCQAVQIPVPIFKSLSVIIQVLIQHTQK